MDEFRLAATPPAATIPAAPRPALAPRAIPIMSQLALVAVVIGAVPLVISQPAPLEDWPNHLARVEILTSLLRGESFWLQYYQLNGVLLPNVALDVGLVGLHVMGLSIATAGTVFLLATYGLFIVGGIRLARAFGASDPIKAPILTMLFYNGALMGGFANFMFGVGLAFCVLAAWVEARDRVIRGLAVAVGGVVAVFIAHLIAAGFLIVAMGLIELHQVLRQRGFALTSLLRHASPAAAAAVVVVLFALTPTTADGPGGGGPIIYTGAPSLVAVVKGKLILLFHPLLDGSGRAGAVIVVGGMGLILFLILRLGHPRLSPPVRFLALGLVLLVLVAPYGIGVGYGLDYRLVAPTLAIVVCATTLIWRGPTARRAVFGILISISVARSGSFMADFWHSTATFRAFDDAVGAIPFDSVLLTGIGSRREEISWQTFWGPPAEYLATDAAASRVFVPTVFALASQHPLILNDRFHGWASFVLFDSPEDAGRSRARLAATCSDWRALGHTGRVMMLLVYPSKISKTLIPSVAVVRSGPGFELIDGCRVTSS